MTTEDAPFVANSGARPRARGRGWIAVAILAFVIGIGATLALLPYIGPRLGWGTTPAAVPTSAPAPVAQPQPSAQIATLQALTAREATLGAQIAVLEQRVAAIDGSARAAASYATRAENMMVIVAVRRALDRGRPLEHLEGQLRDRFALQRPDAVRRILSIAPQPVTLEDLRSSLDGIAPQLIGGPVGEDWWGSLRREASQLIVLRQGTTPTSRPADRLERARRRLDTGQVELALAEVERMPGAANAAGWMRSARRYLDARNALIDLEVVALDAPLPAPAAQAVPVPAVAPASDPLAPSL